MYSGFQYLLAEKKQTSPKDTAVYGYRPCLTHICKGIRNHIIWQGTCSYSISIDKKESSNFVCFVQNNNNNSVTDVNQSFKTYSGQILIKFK